MVEEEEGGGGGGHRRRHFLWRLLRPATERLLSVDSGEIVNSGGIVGDVCGVRGVILSLSEFRIL